MVSLCPFNVSNFSFPGPSCFASSSFEYTRVSPYNHRDPHCLPCGCRSQQGRRWGVKPASLPWCCKPATCIRKVAISFAIRAFSFSTPAFALSRPAFSSPAGPYPSPDSPYDHALLRVRRAGRCSGTPHRSVRTASSPKDGHRSVFSHLGGRAVSRGAASRAAVETHMAPVAGLPCPPQWANLFLGGSGCVRGGWFPRHGVAHHCIR